MQDLQTGEMVALPDRLGEQISNFREQMGTPMGQVDFKDVPIPVGRQGPIFRVGDIIEMKPTFKGAAETGLPEGVSIKLVINRILKKGLVVGVVDAPKLDMRRVFIRTQIVEMRGGRFKVETAGMSMAVLKGIPGQYMKAGH